MACNESDPKACEVKTMQLNDQKAGMQGLDKVLINKIILDASKGSSYFAFQEKRQQRIDRRINEMLSDLKKIDIQQRKDSIEKMNALGTALEAERDLSHSIVHIDMDAFFAAVEMQDNPSLRDTPMAVGSMSMLSTSNYHARKFGVRAAMPGFIAKKLCPELVIVPCHFDKYKKVSHEVRNIVKEYDPNYVAASLDEVCLDLTQYILKKNQEKWHKEHCCADVEMFDSSGSDDISDASQHLELSSDLCKKCKWDITNSDRDLLAFEIVQEIRKRIFDATQLTASAGIAPNTMLAKVCSDQNKPNGQFQICSNVEEVKKFISLLPVKKVSGIGPVQGQLLNAIGIHTCTDLWDKRDIVDVLFTPASVHFYMRAGLGLGSTSVKSDYVRKSIGVEETFKETWQPNELHQKCQELCEEMIEDLKSHNMVVCFSC